MDERPHEGIDATEFRGALSRWATGVAVVSVRHDDEIAATTVSSFTSLSLEPPLVLVALTMKSRTLGKIESSARFSVSVLGASQRSVAEQCAAVGAPDETLFDHDASVRDAIVSLSCSLHEVRTYGDHLLVVGEVIAVRQGPEAAPLLYWNRAYRAGQHTTT